MATFLYGDFVRNIAARLDEALAQIESVHNFEYGIEFEVAICKTLRQVLPHRFGICRGYAANEEGEVAGDDILIYERVRYPTLRLLGEDYSQKEKVPIEAVFAYIEAKHTMNLIGDGDSSLLKALRQTAAVKVLCERREAVPLNQIAPHTTLGKGFNIPDSPGWPKKLNPMYTSIFARRVRLNPQAPIINDPTQVYQTLVGQSLPIEKGADFIAAGCSNLALPVVQVADGQNTIKSPFLLGPQGTLACRVVDEIAFGVALVHLLWALDNIQLGSMPWTRILGNSLGL